MIEKVIYKHLRYYTDLSEILTTYSGIPAVFNKEFPSDQDCAWKPGSQYPRLAFELSMQEDPERKVSGTLSVDFFYRTDSGIFAEEAEPVIRSALDGFFFSDGVDTLAAAWRQSDPFTTPEDGNRINGITLTFDVVAFPIQITTDPDPVKALNQYVKYLFPGCTVVGADGLHATWKPTDENPAIYCRIVKIENGSITGGYNVTWYDPTIQIHVMAPSSDTRSSILKTIAEDLQARTRIILPDNSPLMIQRMTVDLGADALKTGQLSVRMTYGVLRKYPDYPAMNHINVKE